MDVSGQVFKTAAELAREEQERRAARTNNQAGAPATSTVRGAVLWGAEVVRTRSAALSPQHTACVVWGCATLSCHHGLFQRRARVHGVCATPPCASINPTRVPAAHLAVCRA